MKEGRGSFEWVKEDRGDEQLRYVSAFEKNGETEIWNSLTSAFGGYAKTPYNIFASAFLHQMEGGLLVNFSAKDCKEEFHNLVRVISEGVRKERENLGENVSDADEDEYDSDPAVIYYCMLGVIRDGAVNMPRESKVHVFLRALKRQ